MKHSHLFLIYYIYYFTLLSSSTIHLDFLYFYFFFLSLMYKPVVVVFFLKSLRINTGFICSHPGLHNYEVCINYQFEGFGHLAHIVYQTPWVACAWSQPGRCKLYYNSGRNICPNRNTSTSTDKHALQFTHIQWCSRIQENNSNALFHHSKQVPSPQRSKH